MQQNAGNFLCKLIARKIHHFFFSFTLVLLIGIAPAWSAGYSCPTYKKYTSCNAGYYLNGTGAGNSCTKCPSGYPNSPSGNTGGITSCYSNTKSRSWTGSQVNGSVPTNCASVSAWNSCSIAACNYVAYSNSAGTGDGTIKSGCSSNSANCTKTPKTVTANANAYVNGTSCLTCSSFSSSYPYSDGGSISNAYCYASKTKTGSQIDPSVPTGCAAQNTSACTPGTCSYKDYYNATDTTCTPSNCTKTHTSCTSAKSSYYLASGVAKTCSSYNSSYPSSDGGNISSSSCYGTFSKSGSQVNGSTPSGCASVTAWNSCTPGSCNYTKYASGTIKTDCSPSNCTKTAKTVTANSNNYVSGATCPSCSSYNASYPKSDGGNISYTSCYKFSTKTGSQNACSKPANSASYTCNSCTPGTCEYKDYNGATDGTCTPSNCTQTVKSVTCNHGYNVSGVACNPITVNCPAGQFMWWWNTTNGNTTCESCHAGFYCPGGTNVYGSGGVGSANSAGVKTISSCPDGYKDGGKGLAQQTDCKISVSGGKYIASANTTTQSTCDKGTYKAAHKVGYGSTSSCDTCPSPNVGSSVYVYQGTAARTSAAGATAATECYLDSSIADYWTHNASYHGFYRCSGKQYYSSSTGYYSNCENSKRFSECNAGYFIDGSTKYSSEFSNNCSACSAGTYTEKYSTASTIGDGTYHYKTSCDACPAGTYNPNTASTSASACQACPSTHPESDVKNGSVNYCFKTMTKTGSQLDPTNYTGCASRTLSACNPGTCNYRDYYNSTDGSCTPNNCTKGQTCTSASANYYLSSGVPYTCSSYSSTYTKSDGGNIGSGMCYITRTNTGTEVAPSLPTGCATQTTNACTKPTCSYKDYAGQSGETCSPGTCTQTHKACTSASANYYLASGVAKTCSSYSSSYPSSGGGNITSDSCFGTFSKSGSQIACSTPANCSSSTCNTCTPGTCNYTKYASGTIKTDCTPDNCQQTVKSVSAKENYYVDGTSCPACGSSYPYSDGGSISGSYCYKNVTLTGSQTACAKPSNSASYTCGTCTPGTCSYRDYNGATDGSCAPDNCTKPVSSVVCNTGYYKSGVTCPACTNKPSNSSYTGTANSNSCPWSCNSGYNQTADNQCGQFCGAGITHIKLGNGLSIPLYSNARTSPAINVKWNNSVCYGSLVTGNASGALNVKVGSTTYHSTN